MNTNPDVERANEIVRLKDQLDITFVKLFILAFIKKYYSEITEEQSNSILFGKEYQPDEEISFENGANIRYFEMVDDFKYVVDTHVSKTINNIYSGIISNFLSLRDDDAKKSFCSSVYLILNHLYFDIEKMIGFNDDVLLQFIGKSEGFDFYKMYYSKQSLSLRSFTFLFSNRFDPYIDSNTKDFITQLRTNPTPSGAGIAGLKLYSQQGGDDVHKTQTLSELKWKGNKADFKDLVVGLVETNCLELIDGINTKEEIGAYLFRLFNVYPDLIPKKYQITINDVHIRNTNDVFLKKMLDAYNGFRAKKEQKQQTKNPEK